MVTSFEYRAHPVGPEVWFAGPMYPLDRADKVVGFWRDYMAEAPDELISIAVFWSVPEDPDIPAKYHGEPMVVLLDADYPDGRLYYWKARYLQELSGQAISVLAEQAARRPSPLTSLDILALGSAFGRVGAGDTPFAYRSAPFMFTVESNWEDPSASQENIAWSRDLYREMGRFSDGGVYLNFPGMAEEGTGQMEAAYGQNHRRLLEVKRRYDPRNLFRDNLVA